MKLNKSEFLFTIIKQHTYYIIMKQHVCPFYYKGKQKYILSLQRTITKSLSGKHFSEVLQSF